MADCTIRSNDAVAAVEPQDTITTNDNQPMLNDEGNGRENPIEIHSEEHDGITPGAPPGFKCDFDDVVGDDERKRIAEAERDEDAKNYDVLKSEYMNSLSNPVRKLYFLAYIHQAMQAIYSIFHEHIKMVVRPGDETLPSEDWHKEDVQYNERFGLSHSKSTTMNFDDALKIVKKEIWMRLLSDHTKYYIWKTIPQHGALDYEHFWEHNDQEKDYQTFRQMISDIEMIKDFAFKLLDDEVARLWNRTDSKVMIASAPTTSMKSAMEADDGETSGKDKSQVISKSENNDTTCAENKSPEESKSGDNGTTSARTGKEVTLDESTISESVSFHLARD